MQSSDRGSVYDCFSACQITTASHHRYWSFRPWHRMKFRWGENWSLWERGASEIAGRNIIADPGISRSIRKTVRCDSTEVWFEAQRRNRCSLIPSAPNEWGLFVNGSASKYGISRSLEGYSERVRYEGWFWCADHARSFPYHRNAKVAFLD